MANRSRKIALGIERKSLRHVAMVAKFLYRNKPWSCKYDRKKKEERIDIYDLHVHDCTREQNSSPYFLLSFDNVNGCLCQEK